MNILLTHWILHFHLFVWNFIAREAFTAFSLAIECYLPTACSNKYHPAFHITCCLVIQQIFNDTGTWQLVKYYERVLIIEDNMYSFCMFEGFICTSRLVSQCTDHQPVPH